MTLRRLRGLVLRLARRRPIAIIVGAALAAPAAWIEMAGRSDEWWVNGLALVGGATGIALVWIGLTGASPDWIEPIQRE
jgi:hypothetical protein